MPDDRDSTQQQRQFRGRSWGVLGPAGEAQVPGAVRIDPFAPPPTIPSQREERFRRYAELRRQVALNPCDAKRIAEAAALAEDLNLAIEAQELWRACLRVDPMNVAAAKHMAALERRAQATGETGVAPRPFDKPREQPPETPPFWTDFGHVLSYPFRGRGPSVLAAASLFFAVGEVVATLNVLFGGFVMLCLFGYVAAWHFDVVSRTAAGKDDLAEFPELVTVIDSCVLPLFAMLGCLLSSFAPTIVLAALTWQGVLPQGTGGLLTLLSVVPCAFVFPMSLTIRALMQSSSEAMAPARVWGAIGRILPDHLAAFVSLAALWFTWAVVRAGLLFTISATLGRPTPDAVLQLDVARIVGWLLYTAAVWPLLLYTWCVQGHLLGCLYRQSYKRLAWFVPATAETARARRMSARFALAGAGGVVLILGGGWLTAAMWRSAGTAMPPGGESPLAAGSTLTYFWENTDGPAGLAVYRFSAQGSGQLLVNAEYSRADDWGVARSTGSVGLIDATSGAVVRGDGEEGGIGMHERSGLHTRFFGPRSGKLSASYLNDWTVRGEARFKGTWNCWRVVDPETTAELYYDKSTGVLVGRKFSGVGFTVTEWLCGAAGLKKPVAMLPPNRNFDAPPAHEAGDGFGSGDDDR